MAVERGQLTNGRIGGKSTGSFLRDNGPALRKAQLATRLSLIWTPILIHNWGGLTPICLGVYVRAEYLHVHILRTEMGHSLD